MQIAIVGMGALGGPIAARLKARTPHTILGVTGREATAAHYREKGLTVRWEGQLAEPVFIDHVLADASLLPDGLDFIILGVKTEAVESCCLAIASKLKSDGLLISLQNGYVLDVIARLVGEHRTAAASTVWTATLLQDLIFDVTGAGTFNMGGLPGVPTARLAQGKELLNLVYPVISVPDIRGALWSKLCINCCIGPVGAISGYTFGQQAGTAAIRRAWFNIIAEVVAVGTKAGYDFVPLKAGLRPSLLAKGRGLPLPLKHLVAWGMMQKYKNGVSSVYQSILKGRKSEVDFINGVPARLGKELGVPTPWNDALIAMVHEIEEGKRKTSPANLQELFARMGHS